MLECYVVAQYSVAVFHHLFELIINHIAIQHHSFLACAKCRGVDAASDELRVGIYHYVAIRHSHLLYGGEVEHVEALVGVGAR